MRERCVDIQMAILSSSAFATAELRGWRKHVYAYTVGTT